MAEYFAYAAQVTEEAPMYLFERGFGGMVPQLEDDYDEQEGKRDASMIERIHRAHGWTDSKMFKNS